MSKKNRSEQTEGLPRFRSNYNQHLWPASTEINNLPSKTVPNQAMTVRELMIRFASGLPIEAGKIPIYEGDVEGMPDIEKMDQIELNNYYRELHEQRKAVTERVKEAREKAEKMKMDKVVEERVAKRQKEFEDKLVERWRSENTISPKQNL